MKKPFYNYIILGIILTFGLSVSAIAEITHYKFGVFPHMSVLKILQTFQPISENFSQQLSKPVRLSTQKNFKKFTDDVMNEKYDIAFIQPFDYEKAKQANYLPLAARDILLNTIIIVGKASPIKSIADLEGKVIAYPSITAAVTKISKRALKKHGVNTESIHTKNHFSCIHLVVINKADACGTANRILTHFKNKKTKNNFKVIFRAPPLPPALFVVHSRVVEADRKKLKQTILSWHKSQAGLKLLKNGGLEPFINVIESDYDKLKNWKD
ncbi:hypothetical protein MNBD_GAMMA12-2622 [hydrothermal vent metagenome]|uniref:Uncharacterized protein n=1 Tax=hydrothermal vent metagenome TaxID=652676 RepID=A0A3B0YU19_9ZZZZ